MISNRLMLMHITSTKIMSLSVSYGDVHQIEKQCCFPKKYIFSFAYNKSLLSTYLISERHRWPSEVVKLHE